MGHIHMLSVCGQDIPPSLWPSLPHRFLRGHNLASLLHHHQPVVPPSRSRPAYEPLQHRSTRRRYALRRSSRLFMAPKEEPAGGGPLLSMYGHHYAPVISFASVNARKGVCTIAVALAAFFLLPGYVRSTQDPFSSLAADWPLLNSQSDQTH